MFNRAATVTSALDSWLHVNLALSQPKALPSAYETVAWRYVNEKRAIRLVAVRDYQRCLVVDCPTSSGASRRWAGSSARPSRPRGTRGTRTSRRPQSGAGMGRYAQRNRAARLGIPRAGHYRAARLRIRFLGYVHPHRFQYRFISPADDYRPAGQRRPKSEQ